MREFILRLFWFTTALFGAAQVSAVDRVELKTGEVLTGKLLRKTPDEVSIQIANGGILTFKTSAVLRVRTPSSDAPEDESQPQEDKAVEENPSRDVKKDAKKESPAPPQPNQRKAPPAETSAPGVPAPTEPEAGLVTDAPHGFAVQPPKGFVPWPEGKAATESKAATVILAYTDPFTHSTFTLTIFTAPDSIEDIKKKTVKSYSEVFSVFIVLRNDKLQKAGKAVSPEAWLVEMESRYGNVVTQQIQVFAKKDENVFLLTYTAAEENYSKSKDSFERSIDTFRFLEATPPAR